VNTLILKMTFSVLYPYCLHAPQEAIIWGCFVYTRLGIN
jgi:hypothetical protein